MSSLFFLTIEEGRDTVSPIFRLSNVCPILLLLGHKSSVYSDCLPTLRVPGTSVSSRREWENPEGGHVHSSWRGFRPRSPLDSLGGVVPCAPKRVQAPSTNGFRLMSLVLESTWEASYTREVIHSHRVTSNLVPVSHLCLQGSTSFGVVSTCCFSGGYFGGFYRPSVISSLSRGAVYVSTTDPIFRLSRHLRVVTSVEFLDNFRSYTLVPIGFKLILTLFQFRVEWTL